jgi:hypothetical protein
VICSAVANICVHYTAASAAALLSGVDPAGRIPTLDPFDLESSLRRIAFLFAGQATAATGVPMRAE